MKTTQKITLYSLIVLIFLGSIGVSVFSHLCSVDGLELSYFIPQEDNCEPLMQEKSCCHVTVEQSDLKQDNIDSEKCCTESVSYYKLSTENADKILKLKLHSKYTNVFLIFPEIFPSIFDKERQIAYQEPECLRRSGREILIAHQVFRI